MPSFSHCVVAALVAGLPLAAQADAYRCVVDGRTTYSDQPCGAQAVLLRDHGSASTSAHTESPSATTYREAVKARVVAAINEGDLIRAAAMAETLEQKGWVRDAERQSAVDAAGKRAEIDRKNQIQATLDATAAADKRAKQPRTCHGTSVSIGNGITSNESTCE